MRERAATAMAAILLHLLFLLLLTNFLVTPEKQKERAREMLLLLRPSAKPKPKPAPPMPQQSSPAPTVPIPQVTPPPLPNPGITGVRPQAPSGLEAFGQALSGCTPEQMGRLGPEDRAKCPPLAAMPMPDEDLLAPPRSHAKDEAKWAEDLRERNWQPNCFGAEIVLKCLIQQSIEEKERASKARALIDEKRRQRNQPPPPPMPKWAGAPPPH